LGAVALVIISTGPRSSSAYRTIEQAQRAPQEDARQKGVGSGVGKGAGESGGRVAPERITVREIDAPALKELLQPNLKQPRPLLVNFWATWCEPCRDEFPDLVRIDADYRARGLEFITISLDDTTEINGDVPQFLNEMKASMPAYLLNVLDLDVAIAVIDSSWRGAFALPVTLLYDARGEIVFKHMGRIKPAELRASIEKVLSEK
jgi:thiol-disulfide isomerase/thioredoxin